MNSLTFLVGTLADIYIMLLLLRLWMQAVRADYYNPFSQFVVKATHPVVAPVRRLVPSIGSLDLATLILAYLFCLLKFVLMTLIASQGQLAFDPAFIYIAALSLVKAAGTLLFYILLVMAIMSWVSQGRSPIEHVFQQLTEPFLAPIRRILPSMGGLDFSVLVLFLILQFANFLVGDFVGQIWYSL